MYRRQQNGNNGASSSAAQSNTDTARQTPTNTRNNNGNNGGSSGSSSASPTKSGGKSTTTGKNSNNSDGNKKTTQKSEYKTTKTFDNRLPAGGVSMITPNAIAGPQYYKIGDYVTYAWNYTSLSMTPSAVDILASCSLNSATYTIALNQSVSAGPDATQAITWDTGKYQATATQPLLMATYTLIIYDAQSEVTAMPRAGYLGTWSQFTFGMYVPQPYTPIADYVCATCNGAMSTMTKHTMGFMAGMAVVTVLSFGWFGGVAGLW